MFVMFMFRGITKTCLAWLAAPRSGTVRAILLVLLKLIVFIIMKYGEITLYQNSKCLAYCIFINRIFDKYPNNYTI